MRAAVCYEFGQPLVVEEIDLDPPGAGEVMVRLKAVAICHSDVHLVRGDWGKWSSQPPVVAGHEAAGVVEAVGEGVEGVRPGEAVVVSLLRSCGQCFYCAGAAPFLCEGQFALARESRLHNKRGERLRHGISTAAFAECAVVHASQLVRMPADMPLDRAALLACGVLTGWGAVANTAGVQAGQSVVVIGAGGVGLNAVQAAAFAGAQPIVAVDIAENKLAAARVFGATHTLLATQADAVKQVKDWLQGRGADYVFVTIGSAAAVSQGLAMLRRGGALVLVGMPPEGAQVSLPIGQFVYDGQRILGSNMGSARLGEDVPRLAELYQQGRLKLDELITARYPLDRINEAIDAMERGEALRNVIVF